MNYKNLLDQAWRSHLESKKDNPTVISIFAGCGGSSLGYSIAGYKELLAVEWDNNAVKSFELNFPDIPIYHGDVHKLSVSQCLSLAKCKIKELDVLDGSPPCQGFSTSGKRKMQDTRNQLYHQFIRLLRGLEPKAFIMENVSGLIKGKMKIIFADIMKELKSSGYQVRCKLLNAKYYLVPQSRQRLIWIGTRNDLEIKPSYSKGIKKIITVRKAWVNIGNGDKGKKLKGIREKLYWATPKGDCLEKGSKKILGKKEYYTSRRLSFSKPSNCLTKSMGSGIYYPNEARYISISELKRLQSYPDQFQLSGTKNKKWGQIGNSVPPLFMYHIANYVKGLLGYAETGLKIQ